MIYIILGLIIALSSDARSLTKMLAYGVFYCFVFVIASPYLFYLIYLVVGGNNK
jgi:hypothetical protein